MITGDDYFDSQEFKNLLKDFESMCDNGVIPFFDLDNLIDIADYYNMVNDGDRETAAIDAALQLYPNASPAVAYKAHQFISDNKLEEARDILSQADDTQEYQYLLTNIELALAGNLNDKALELARKMVMSQTDGKDRHDAAIDTANIMIDYEQDNMAAELINIIADKDSDEVNEVKARIAICRQDFNTAIGILDYLLSKYPFSKKYWTSMATSQYMAGNIDDAMESCNYLLAIDPDDPIGLYTKATIQAHQENYQQAAKLFDHYLTLPNHGPEALLDNADCKINMMDFHEAIALCRQFINEAASSKKQLIGEAYYTMIMTYFAIADKENAKAMRKEGDAYLTNQQKTVIDTKLYLEKMVCKGNADVLDRFVHKNIDNVDMLMLAFDTAYDNAMLHMAYSILKRILTLTEDGCNRGYGFMTQLCHILGYTDEMVIYLHLALKHCRTELVNLMTVAEMKEIIKCDEITEESRQILQDIISNKQQTE